MAIRFYFIIFLSIILVDCKVISEENSGDSNLAKTSNLIPIESYNLDSILFKNLWFVRGLADKLPDTIILKDTILYEDYEMIARAEFKTNDDLLYHIFIKSDSFYENIHSKWNQIDNKIRFTFPTEVREGSDDFKNMWYTYYIIDYSTEEITLVDSLIYNISALQDVD
jgi:hypothetical protein